MREREREREKGIEKGIEKVSERDNKERDGESLSVIFASRLSFLLRHTRLCAHGAAGLNLITPRDPGDLPVN